MNPFARLLLCAGLTAPPSGPAEQLPYSLLSDVVVAVNGDVYVADPGRGRILCISERWGPPRTVAVFDGRGPIVWPGRLALGGGALFVSDPRTHRVARVGLEDGAVEVVAGSGGPGLDRDGRALEVPLSHPAGIAVDGERLWIADLGNRALRAVDLSAGTIATVAGGWDATRTVHEGGFFRSPDRFLPSDLAFGRGGELLVLDLRERGVLELDPESGQLEPVAGTTNLSETGNTGVDWRVAARRDFAVDPDGRLLFAEGPAGRVVRCSADGGREVLPAARLAWPAAVDVDREGRVYVVDAGRGILSRVDPDGSASTLWRSETPPPDLPGGAREVLRQDPDPDAVPDPAVRAAIEASGFPWHVRHAPTGIELVLVPAGTYVRGARSVEEDVRGDARPPHGVRITRPLYVALTEVTNAQFRRLDPNHVSLLSVHHDLNEGLEGATFDRDDQPATNLSWYDAVDFARRFGMRLPTEAEWEYFARAGVESAYLWGDALADGAGWANLAGESVSERISIEVTPVPFEDEHLLTAPVASYRRNRFGLHDVVGNVWEWCADWYSAEEYLRCAAGVEDPRGPESGERKVLRGGSWQMPFRGSALLSFRANPGPRNHFVLSRGARMVLDP